MDAKKNLCAMIPADLHAKVIAEKEQLALSTLGEYVELVLKEHFEGGKTIMAATKTLAFQISEELDQRLKNFIATEKSVAGRSARRSSSSDSSNRRWPNTRRRTRPRKQPKNEIPHGRWGTYPGGFFLGGELPCTSIPIT